MLLSSRPIFQSLKVIKIPDTIRYGRLKSFFDFYSNIIHDYSEVGKDCLQYARDFRVKTASLVTILGTFYAAYKTNPSIDDLADQLNSYTTEMGLVDPNVRSKECYRWLERIHELSNQKVLRRFNLTFFSLLWEDDFPEECGHYAGQCIYLKPKLFPFLSEPSRIVDVGVFGRWRLLDYRLTDYDINPEEWIDKSSP